MLYNVSIEVNWNSNQWSVSFLKTARLFKNIDDGSRENMTTEINHQKRLPLTTD